MFGKNLFRRASPNEQIGADPASAVGRLGIAVLSYNRPRHLEATHESLNRQGEIGRVHVWIDGTQGRREFNDANHASVSVARRFQLCDLHSITGHLGVKNMMLETGIDNVAGPKSVFMKKTWN